MALSIQKAGLPDVDSITTLLNEATAQLHQKGIMQWEYPWNPAQIKAEIQKGWVWSAKKKSVLIGTFSLRPLPLAPWLPGGSGPDGQWYLYRLALLPEWQGKELGRELLRFACDLARNAQKNLYLDCWAGNTALRKIYSSSGFDTIGIFPEENYEICVFSYRFDR